MKQAFIILAFFLVLTWGAYDMNPLETLAAVANELDDKATRGSKVSQSTPSTAEIRNGTPVNETPEQLAAQATQYFRTKYGADFGNNEITTRAYSLARVIRSERSTGGSNQEAAAIAFICINIANASYNGDVVAAVTGGKMRYGRQMGNHPPVASSVDPYERDVTVALGCLSGEIEDLTQGARNFMHPKGFKTTEEFETKRDAWIAKGLTPISIPGAPQIMVFA